ncbi:MAG: LysR substrate-binding domain-containing protein [Pseudomonadota bacterium]
MQTTHRASLRGLRTFCMAARFESFRVAADLLFVTASAVSHQIKSLEDEFDLRLFDRTGRQLQLTDAGRSLYEKLAPLIDQIDDVVNAHVGAAPSKRIRISVQPFFGSEYFVPRLSAFTQAYPDIEIYVASSDESADTHPKDADLSIRLYRSPPTGLSAERLFPLRLAPAGSVEFKQAMRVRKQTIQTDFPLIVHETLPNAWQEWARATGFQLPERQKVTRLESMIAVLRATQKGLGAALVPVPMGELWFTEGSVVRLFDAEYESSSAYYLVWREERGKDDAIDLFRRWVLDTFAEDC